MGCPEMADSLVDFRQAVDILLQHFILFARLPLF